MAQKIVMRGAELVWVVDDGQPSPVWTPPQQGGQSPVAQQTATERLQADIEYLERLLKDPATAGPPPPNPYPCCQFVRG
jgi:hypothetical protein